MPALTNQYFHAGHWGQCLELLSHLCQYSESILLVSGPPGIGKSALKQALIEQEAENFSFCEIEATPNLGAENLVTIIESKVDQAAGKDLALLIDDAENLSINVMAVLLQLKRRPDIQQHLHIVLFANQDFEQKLSQSVLKEEFNEMVHVIELEPLTLVELESFLTQQFDLTLDKAAYKKIYAQTGGIPGKVEKIAKDLKSGDKVKTFMKKGISPLLVGSTVCAGVVFCFLAILWPEADDKLIQSQPLVNIAQAAPQEARPEDSNSPSVNSGSENTATTAETEPSTVENPAAEAEPQQQVAPEPEIAVLTVEQEKIVALEKQLTELQQMLAREQQARVNLEAKIKEIKAVANVKPKLKTKNKSKLKPSANINTKVKANKLELKGRTYNNDEKYILGVASKNYSLQLLSSDNLKKMQAFMKENDLGPQMHLFKTSHQGKPWYVLIYGNYTSRAAAVEAIDKLPFDVKKLRPWPREYARIQSSIKNER